jgi:hypothetical protein
VDNLKTWSGKPISHTVRATAAYGREAWCLSTCMILKLYSSTLLNNSNNNITDTVRSTNNSIRSLSWQLITRRVVLGRGKENCITLDLMSSQHRLCTCVVIEAVESCFIETCWALRLWVACRGLCLRLATPLLGLLFDLEDVNMGFIPKRRWCSTGRHGSTSQKTVGAVFKATWRKTAEKKKRTHIKQNNKERNKGIGKKAKL